MAVQRMLEIGHAKVVDYSPHDGEVHRHGNAPVESLPPPPLAVPPPPRMGHVHVHSVMPSAQHVWKSSSHSISQPTSSVQIVGPGPSSPAPTHDGGSPESADASALDAAEADSVAVVADPLVLIVDEPLPVPPIVSPSSSSGHAVSRTTRATQA